MLILIAASFDFRSMDLHDAVKSDESPAAPNKLRGFFISAGPGDGV